MIFRTELDKPENAALKEYDRIRKAKQAKLERSRNKETDEDVGKAQAEYDAWSEDSKVFHDKFVGGEISEGVFGVEIKKY